MKPLYWLCRTSATISSKLLFRTRIIGSENLVGPNERGTIIASNHQSFLDPPLVATAYKGEIHFLARETLFKGMFGKLIAAINAVPINQNGADLASLKTIITQVKKGNRVLVFPEGTRTPDGTLQPAAAGIGLIVAKSQALVQPIRIEGAYDALPRNRSSLKLAPITITIGKPLDFSHMGKVRSKEQYQEIADTIMEKIAEL